MPKENKLESNWTTKTLESLEKNIWPPINSSQESYLVNTTHALRKKQLKDFSIEDLRIMIGQDIGLKFLVPFAISILQNNILAEGDYYEGDLLKSVLTSDKNYWANSKENWVLVCRIFEKNEQTLHNTDTTWEIKKTWFDSYKEFKSIH